MDSKALPNIVKRAIGLYPHGKLAGPFGLGIGRTCAYYHNLGWYPIVKMSV